MKKLLITTFAFLFSFGVFASVALAGSASFNTDPRDLPTVTVSNASDTDCEAGPADGCWKTSVNARPGDLISVQVYFHNTGTGTAPDVSVGMSPKNSSSKTTHTFSGGVAAYGQLVSSGSATVRLSDGETLNYVPGSTRLFANQSTSGAKIGGDTYLFTSAGVDIGDVEAGWEGQGVLVADFRVGGSSDDSDDEDLPQCDDDRDNDGDGRVDYPSDPGCSSRSDDNEYNSSNDDEDDECDIDTFKASRTSIERGQTVTITWKVADADRVYINGVSKSKSGSMSVSPYTTTTYRLEVEGDGCEDDASIRINVNEANDSRPQAITTIATIFGSTSAQLNGIAVPNTNTGSTSAWFEWGPTSALGYRTSSKSMGTSNGSIPYGDIVNGLVPGTTYYYRAAVENQNGTAYGSIVPFRTQNSVQGTVVTQGPTRVVVQTVRDSVTAESAPSLLELRVESAYDHMCVGGEMEYVVTYRNISTVTLEDTVLRIALPKELTYAGADRGNFDPIDNIVTLDIGRVSPGESGSVTVRARVNENAIRGNLTVMTATVVYTNPITRAQEDAIAYSLITVSDECPTVLGASVVGFGSFLPDTLLEWLLLILVILALILLGRNMYKKREEQKA